MEVNSFIFYWNVLKLQDHISPTDDDNNNKNNNKCRDRVVVMFCVCADDEGSGRGKKASKCGNCKFGAECDEDSEDMLLVHIPFKIKVYTIQDSPRISDCKHHCYTNKTVCVFPAACVTSCVTATTTTLCAAATASPTTRPATSERRPASNS